MRLWCSFLPLSRWFRRWPCCSPPPLLCEPLGASLSYVSFLLFSPFYRRIPTCAPSSTRSLDLLGPSLLAWARAPCVLCGCGDSLVQHWLASALFLLSPVVTFLIRGGPQPFGFYTLPPLLLSGHWWLPFWVGTGQCVHERSGLPPPSLCPPAVFSSDPLIMLRHLVDRGFSLIPAAYQPTHVRPLSPFNFRLFPGSCCFSYLHPGTRGVCDEIDLEEMILSHFVSNAQR